MFVRRVLAATAVLFGITVLVFVVIRLVPGDPISTVLSRASIRDPALVARFRVEYGLDQPLPVQFLAWFRHVVAGDLGASIVSSERVSDLIWRRLGATLLLGAVAAVLSFAVGIAWGVAAAGARGFGGRLLRFIPLLGLTIPPFSIGIALSFVFAVALKILPSSGIASQLDGGSVGDIAVHMILPAITLAVFPAALTARITQATLDELQNEDFVRTARAAGIPSRRITFRHVLPNALLPVITSGGVLAGYLLTGAVFVETVFNWPGIGTLIVKSVLNRDYPVIQACALVIATTYVSLSLIADLLYLRVDPRISFQQGRAR
jgi:peptide/nickel transport system permease protein